MFSSLTLDAENEDILVQIQEEQRPFSLPDEASGRNVVEIVFVLLIVMYLSNSSLLIWPLAH